MAAPSLTFWLLTVIVRLLFQLERLPILRIAGVAYLNCAGFTDLLCRHSLKPQYAEHVISILPLHIKRSAYFLTSSARRHCTWSDLLYPTVYALYINAILSLLPAFAITQRPPNTSCFDLTTEILQPGALDKLFILTMSERTVGSKQGLYFIL